MTRASQLPRQEATESGTTGSDRPRETRTLEEDVDVASNRATRFDAISTQGTAAVDLEGSGIGAF